VDDPTGKGRWSWGTTDERADDDASPGDPLIVDEAEGGAPAEPSADVDLDLDPREDDHPTDTVTTVEPPTESVGELAVDEAPREQPVAVAAPKAERRRGPAWPLVALIAALVGALAGGGVAALVANDDDAPTTQVRFTGNNAPIGEPKDIQGILAKVQPGVVSIRTSTFQGGDLFGSQPVRGAGTGMVISADGEVLTNAHVVNGATSIKVTLFGESEARDADLLGSNPSSDVAVVKIRNASGLPTVELGDSSRIQVGDDVVAIGNALALPGGPSVTLGIVSAKDRSIDAEDVQLASLIQTDAAINPGNSGGPLVNSGGQVIGMNTAIRGDAQNIGFAIAIDTVKPQLDALKRGGGGVTSTAFLGVSTQTLTPEMREQFDFTAEEGVVVVSTAAGSPAENAGLRRADVITSFAGTKITTAEALVSAVQAKKPGDKAEIVFRRGEQERRVTVTLGSRQVGGQ
jgi:putative serine protease PepD